MTYYYVCKGSIIKIVLLTETTIWVKPQPVVNNAMAEGK